MPLQASRCPGLSRRRRGLRRSVDGRGRRQYAWTVAAGPTPTAGAIQCRATPRLARSARLAVRPAAKRSAVLLGPGRGAATRARGRVRTWGATTTPRRSGPRRTGRAAPGRRRKRQPRDRAGLDQREPVGPGDDERQGEERLDHDLDAGFDAEHLQLPAGGGERGGGEVGEGPGQFGKQLHGQLVADPAVVRGDQAHPAVLVQVGEREPGEEAVRHQDAVDRAETARRRGRRWPGCGAPGRGARPVPAGQARGPEPRRGPPSRSRMTGSGTRAARSPGRRPDWASNTRCAAWVASPVCSFSCTASGRQGVGVAGPAQQRVIEVTAQPAQRCADGRLADSQFPGGPGHADLPQQRVERDEQVQVKRAQVHPDQSGINKADTAHQKLRLP